MSEAMELVSEGVMSIPNAAKFTGLSRSKLYQLMDAGKIAYVKVGRSRRIPKRELVEFLAGNLIPRRADWL